MIKKKLLFSISLPIVSTVLVVPSIASIIHNDVVPTILANSIAQEKANKKLETPPETLDDLKATPVEDLITLTAYDSRKYGLVTPIKFQGTEGLCWCYSTAATSETSILKEGLSPIIKDDPSREIDLSEHNIDYGTNVRTKEMDRLGLNPEDDDSKPLNKGGIVQKAMTALSMWNAPVDSNIHTSIGWNYMQPDYYLESTDRISGTESSFATYGIPDTVKRIKRLIAQYGAVTCSYSCNGTFEYTNTNYRAPGNAGHAVSIIGWDDTIAADKYVGVHATLPGGWLCKNSWGDFGPKPEDRYFWISYDSPIFDINGVNYTKANTTYNNNYYYDAHTSEGTGVNEGKPNASGKQENAAIFPVKRANFNRKESLKAISVGVTGDNPKVTVTVYTNVQADLADAKNPSNDPTRGTPVTTKTVQYEYPGYKLIELPTPIDLEFGTNFSVVVKVENKTGDAEILYGNDFSTNNMTFYKDTSGAWINPMIKIKGCAARIKAFTSEVEDPTITAPTDLKYAHVVLDKDIWEYGDKNRPVVKSATLGNKTLTTSDYELVYNPLIMNSKISPGSVSDIIGRSSVTLQGIGAYNGTSITIPYQIEVGDAPDLQGLGNYILDDRRAPTRMDLWVKRGVTKYSEITLPRGFKWNEYSGDINAPVKPGPAALDLKYSYKDEDYYYITYWGASKVNLIYTDANITPTPPPELPPIAGPEDVKPTPPPPPPAPTKTIIDKVNDAIQEGSIVPYTTRIEESEFNSINGNNVLNKINIPTINSSEKSQLRVTGFSSRKPNASFRVTCNGETSKIITVWWDVFTPPPLPPVITLQRVNITGLQNSYQEGQSITATATPVFSDGVTHTGVTYTWRANGSTYSGERLSIQAKYGYTTIEVTAYYNGQTATKQQTITVIKAPAPTPVPPPQPHPQPEPSPTPITPILQSVKILYLKPSYNEGETISVSVEPKFNTSSIPSGISYHWTIDGRDKSSDKNFKTKAMKEYNGTSIQVTVTYGSRTETASSKLTVKSNAVTPTPSQPTESHGMDMKTIIIIAGAGGGFLLLLILISLLIAHKRRQSWE